jgi:hypothetical protein
MILKWFKRPDFILLLVESRFLRLFLFLGRGFFATLLIHILSGILLVQDARCLYV